MANLTTLLQDPTLRALVHERFPEIPVVVLKARSPKVCRSCGSTERAPNGVADTCGPCRRASNARRRVGT